MKNLDQILCSLSLVADLLQEDIKAIEQKDDKGVFFETKKLIILLGIQVSLVTLIQKFEKLKYHG